MVRGMEEDNLEIRAYCHSAYGDHESFQRQVDIVKAAGLTFDPGDRSWGGQLPAAVALDTVRWRLVVEAAEAGAGIAISCPPATANPGQSSWPSSGAGSGTP